MRWWRRRLFLGRGSIVHFSELRKIGRVFIFLAASGLLFPQVSSAGGRLVLLPELGFFSLSAIDKSTDATAVVSSIYDWGMYLAWYQGLSNKMEGFVKVGLRAFGMNSPSSAAVLNPNQNQLDFFLGVRRPLGGRLNFNVWLDLNQYLLMSSATVNQIALNVSRWPGIGMNFEYMLLGIKKVQLMVSLGGGAAIPLDNSGYGIDLNAEGRALLTFSIKRFGIMMGPYARLQTVGSSIITQYYAELGATIIVGLTIGKLKGKYMFSFSPRK